MDKQTRTIIEGLMELARESGRVLRYYDEDSEYTHLWCNDGSDVKPKEYVPDDRYFAAEAYLEIKQ